MRFFIALTTAAITMHLSRSSSIQNNSIAEIGATSVLIDDGGCQQLCDNTTACRDDPHYHGSYCKFWQNPAVCFGLYSREGNFTSNISSNANNSQNLCFQPNDGGCNDLELPPVICPQQTNTTCSLICSQTFSCLRDPRGSYCKTDMDLCFGLYWTNSSRTEACYQPTDPSCPTSFPIACTGETTPGSSSTTSQPITTEGSTSSGAETATTSQGSTESTTETVSSSPSESTSESPTTVSSATESTTPP